MTNRTPTIDERLKKHHYLKERIEALLDIAESKEDGPADTANAVEERTIIEVRKLGQEVMKNWAESKVAKEIATHQKNYPEARAHKKKQLAGTPLLGRSE